TRAHALTTADLAGQADVPRPPDGPKLVKSQSRDTLDAAASQPPTPLFADWKMGDFRARWSSIQTGFVDEPRRTVEAADKLVALVMQRLAEGFAAQRSGLEQACGGGDAATRGRFRDRAIGFGKAVGPGRQRLHRGPAACPAALSFVLRSIAETVRNTRDTGEFNNEHHHPTHHHSARPTPRRRRIRVQAVVENSAIGVVPFGTA